MRSVVRLLLLSTLFALAAGCASQKEVEVLPEQTYYENARKAMNSGNFNEAELWSGYNCRCQAVTARLHFHLDQGQGLKIFKNF